MIREDNGKAGGSADDAVGESSIMKSPEFVRDIEESILTRLTDDIDEGETSSDESGLRFRLLLITNCARVTIDERTAAASLFSKLEKPGIRDASPNVD